MLDEGRLEVRHVGYFVVGGAVQGLLQALLVEDVAEDADGAAYYEQGVEAAHLYDVGDLFLGERARARQHVHEADADAAYQGTLMNCFLFLLF